MDCQAKEDGAKRITLLDPLSRMQGGLVEEKDRRRGVTQEDIGGKLQYALPNSLQHLVPSDGVERILEIELDEDVIG